MIRTALAAICLTLTLWTVSGAAAHSRAGRVVLAVSISGNGKITSSDGRIDCGSQCSASYRRGSIRKLTASPSEGFDFVKWEGDCIGIRTDLRPRPRPDTAGHCVVHRRGHAALALCRRPRTHCQPTTLDRLRRQQWHVRRGRHLWHDGDIDARGRTRRELRGLGWALRRGRHRLLHLGYPGSGRDRRCLRPPVADLGRTASHRHGLRICAHHQSTPWHRLPSDLRRVVSVGDARHGYARRGIAVGWWMLGGPTALPARRRFSDRDRCCHASPSSDSGAAGHSATSARCRLRRCDRVRQGPRHRQPAAVRASSESATGMPRLHLARRDLHVARCSPKGDVLRPLGWRLPR